MKKLSLISYLFVFIFSIRGAAQDSDLGNWLIYIGNKKINSKWDWHNEVQYRNYNAVGDLEQLLLRTGIGYNLTENNNNLLVGYGFIHSQNYINAEDKTNLDEHRIFQQFITRQSISRVKVQHRYRFEQRWVEDADFRLRFRYFLALNIPFSSKAMDSKTWYGSIYNEIFINNNQVIFDRNRLYFGLGYKLNATARFELGYMNQFLNNGNRDQINLISFVSF
ncbi:MAG: DUF2490 domain-containing protein [Bacteroidota bacterium]